MTGAPEEETHFPERRDRRELLRRGLAVLGALLLLGVGVAAGVTWSERHAAKTARQEPAPAATPAPSAAGGMRDMPGMPAPSGGSKPDEAVEVSLTPDALQRAGIKTAVVTAAAATSALTVPATVTSNAYRDTKVNALVGGVVRQVLVELGASVKRGEPLAVIFSADLAEGQTKYLSMQAMLEADHQKLVRTEKLVGLGAASRQELEEVTATHVGHATEVAAARQRLLLLGLSGEQVAQLRDASHVVSEVTVHAPGHGAVIGRAVNPGQVVTAGQELFTVTDLGTFWVIGDLYEKDFASVRVGSPASVTLPTTPGRPLNGRVAYIDPRVDPATRTAKVRVEVPNRNGELRLGMFVTLSFQTGTGQQITLVPRSAVQTIGDRAVVYVPVEGEEGKFVERPVKVGTAAVGELAHVVEGVKPGEKVVTDGSFFLRAEAARTRTGG